MKLLFAWRYFRSKKSTNAVNIISWVSVFAMAVGTAALITVLSVFNGFEYFIKDLYSNFYPEIKITAVQKSTFSISDSTCLSLRSIAGIKFVSKTLEEKILFSFEDNQAIATLKGIDTSYNLVTGIAKNVRYGRFNLADSGKLPNIVLGVGISNRLGASEESHEPITCYSFKRESSMQALDPTQMYNTNLFTIEGVYVLQDDIDNQYAFASLKAVQELAEKENQISSIEIKLKSNEQVNEVMLEIQKLFPAADFRVESRWMQNKTLYFILKSERWAVYAILTLMLLIASFNIIGSLSMLVMEKEKDIRILKSMGMENKDIQQIFLSTGVFLSLIGASIGCALATILLGLQQQFGFIKLGNADAFLINAYPVKMIPTDYVLVLVTVVFIAALASWIPARKASKVKMGAA